MKAYASIRFERAIGPVCPGNTMADAFVAADGYSITREGDTIRIDHDRAPAAFEVPWARVVSATCVAPMPEEEAFVTSETVISGEELLKRRGGWPKGKPRKPAAEGES